MTGTLNVKSPRDVCKCASRVVTGEDAVFWSPFGLMVYKCKPCKPQEADLQPVTHSPNEEAGGVYLITLMSSA